VGQGMSILGHAEFFYCPLFKHLANLSAVLGVGLQMLCQQGCHLNFNGQIKTVWPLVVLVFLVLN